MNPKLLKQQFEKSFNTYNDNAIVQKAMAEILVEEVSKIKKEFENILELGCGTGLLTSEFSKKIVFKNFYANDLIKKSETYIKKIVPQCQFYFGNALNIKPAHKMDLIISNAVFQWFENLEKAGKICSSMLNKGGFLAFTSFTPDNFKEIRDLTGLTLDYKTLDEVKDVFSKDFEILYAKEYSQTLKFSTPLELLAHMKNTGVNSLSAKNWTIKDIKNFCDKYKEKYPDIRLTYAGIIVICKKTG